jgi:hypothetical protein
VAAVRQDQLLSVYSPALNREVVLYRQTWEEHILPSRPGLKSKLNLIERIITSKKEELILTQKADDPERVAIQKEVPDFLPLNRYLRIAVKMLDKPNDKAIMLTAIPVDNVQKTGVKRL